MTPHAKITKGTEYDSSILEHQMSNGMLRPTPVIMIKLTELTLDLFWQINSMNSDGIIAD